MRESSIVKLIAGGTLAILAAWTSYWFFNNFEKATREVTLGYSREAQDNPFLAAERYLTRLGVNASSLSASELWSARPQPGDVVIFYHFTLPRSKTRQGMVRKWVESGGHLIIDADSLPAVEAKDTKANDFLSELGVRIANAAADDGAEEQQISIRFAEVPQPANVTMSSSRHLVDSTGRAIAGARLGDGYGLLQYEVGDGYVTVLADNSFLTNRHIGEEDHALALALLVGINHSSKVWLVRDVITPSLPALAWKYAPEAMVAAVTALLLGLWGLGTHLGPQLPPAQTARRDIGEHLAATAHYLWRLDHGKELMQANRHRIEQAWLNKHYILRAMPQHERYAWIATRSGLTAAVVERAFYMDHDAESDFIELSSYLQILRMAL